MDVTITIYYKKEDIDLLRNIEKGKPVVLSNGDYAGLCEDGEIEITHDDEVFE